MKIISWFGLCIGASLWFSCQLDKPKWDVTFMIPLAYSDLTPANIFGDTLVDYDPSAQVYFSYDNEIFRLNLDTLMEIPDTGFTYSLSLPGAITIYPGNPLTVYNNYVVFRTPDIALNHLVVGSGEVYIRAETEAQARVQVTYSAPKATKNGVPFSLVDTIEPAPPGGVSVLERVIDLSGYSFDLTGDNQLQSNRLRIIIQAEIPSVDPPLPVPAGTQLVNSKLTFRKIKPYYARGSVQTRTLEINPEPLTISLFNLVKAGTFQMTQPELKVVFENGVGLDLSARITEFRGVNERTGQEVALQSPATQGFIQLGRAQNVPSPPLPYTPVFSTLVLNGSNSNLKQFVENMPSKIYVKGKATLNPIPGAGAGHDFLYNVSKTAASLKMWFPMGFSFNQLILADTVPYSTAGLPPRDRLKSLHLMLHCENTYPFHLLAQLYVVNEQGHPIDSLLSEYLIPAAPPSLNGLPNEPVSVTLEGRAEGTRLERFLNGTRLYWKLHFHSPYPGSVPLFYDFYRLKARLVARAEVRL
ncbi:MAG: hypothetical protein N2110_04735 [Flavobacteriales bacterium]|nr:hypothetical protein [Flavobacteriales bacterium]